MVAHTIQLKGSISSEKNTQGMAPTLLRFKNQNFVEALLENLKDEQGRAQLEQQVAAHYSDQHVLQLCQPIHRVFHMVLVDASCTQFGEPRLDSARIHSSGFVIRRLDTDGGVQAWVRQNGKTLGWRSVGDMQEDYDVDPALRARKRIGKNPVLTQLPNPIEEGYIEEHLPLYVTSPDINENAKRTYLYGNVILSSAERSESEDAPMSKPFSKADLKKRLPAMLRRNASNSQLPPTNATVTLALVKSSSYKSLFDTLHYLSNEVGIYTETAKANEVRAQLRRIPLDRYSSLDSFFDVLNKRLVQQSSQSTSVILPSHWTKLSRSQEKALFDAIYACVSDRFESMAPIPARYDSNSRYILQSFVRVQTKPGCPPRTVWTQATEPFEVMPWYESCGDVAPTMIELPDLTPSTLKKLKPNVAFKVPESVQKFMDNINMDGLLDGKKPASSQFELGMICSFSIPIITLCAFIVLQIFLSLLNIVFFWMAFIRICIPFPKPK